MSATKLWKRNPQTDRILNASHPQKSWALCQRHTAADSAVLHGSGQHIPEPTMSTCYATQSHCFFKSRGHSSRILVGRSVGGKCRRVSLVGRTTTPATAAGHGPHLEMYHPLLTNCSPFSLPGSTPLLVLAPYLAA